MRNKSPRPISFLSIIFLTFLLLLQACNLPTAKKEPSSPQADNLQILEKASQSKPDFTFQNGFPLSGRFDIAVEGANPVERARNFLSTYGTVYGQGSPDLALELRRANGANNEHVIFYQTYKGIEVFGGELVVQLDGDHVKFTSGNLLHGDVLIDTTPALTDVEGEDAARTALNAADATTQGQTKLMIYDPSLFDNVSPNPKLAWRVVLSGGPVEAYVDAHDGTLLFSASRSADDFELDLETANENNAEASGCYFGTTDDDWIGDEDGMDRDYFWDPDAVDLWWYERWAYDFYSAYGFDSYNNSGAEVEAYVHASVPNGKTTDCPTGVIFEFRGGWVGLDVVVHEFTHGVILASSNLVYSGQSGALNESFADVMSAAQDGNWLHGEAMTLQPGPTRDLSIPTDMSQYNDMGGLDHGGVHTNSAIPSYAAYLLAVGGAQNGWTVEGIGAAKEARLMLTNMYTLASNAQFINARDNAVQWALNWAAKGDNGFTDFDVCQVRNAYAAIGLGQGDLNCDGVEDSNDADNDFRPNTVDNCPLVYNPDQKDIDGDGLGDACDPDQDEDGLLNENDNCPLVSNGDQSDGDGNNIGDACQDTDGDSLIDISDNCPADANLDQKDADADGQGDVCDPDDDNDGVPDLTDNAVFVQNPGQEDKDSDNVGDIIDNCVDDPNTDQADADHDGQGNACDPDADNDGILNADDNCPVNKNADQFDLNKNGIGTACDDEDQATLQGFANGVKVPLTADPNSFFKLKIPLCAGGCPDDWGLDTFSIDMLVQDLPLGALVFVTDESGGPAGKSPVDGGFQNISFHPMGGHEYFLNIAFGPDIKTDQDVSFSLSVSEGDSADVPYPTSSGPTSTPLPPPPAIDHGGPITTTPTLTSTPTPTGVASGPTFTLTKNAFCRKGPATSFKDVDAILSGETVEILNVSTDGLWYFVFWKQKNVKCWVSVGAGLANGPLQAVQVLIGPATYTPTPAAFIPPSPTDTGKP